MADGDHRDPGSSPGEINPKDFYRETPAPVQPRITQSVNISDYLRTEGDPPPIAPQQSQPDSQLLNQLYEPAPAYHPARAFEALVAQQAAQQGSQPAAPRAPQPPPPPPQPPPVQASPQAVQQVAQPVAPPVAPAPAPPQPAAEPVPQVPTEQAEPQDAPIVPSDVLYASNQYVDPDQIFYDQHGNVIDEPPPAKKAQSPLVRFAAIGGLLGIVFGAVLVLMTWLLGSPSGPYDLGNSSVTATGLKGHLFTKWEDKTVQYRLTVAPSDPDYHTAFANAVSNPPHPLTIGLQLKDAMGFVLCTKDVTLKYDPTANAAPGADLAQLAAAEAEREKGKDLFQTANGSDGRIESLNAQGAMPCSSSAYSKVVAWSFTPDFPSLSEQTDLMKQQAERQAAAAARKHPAQKPAEHTLGFSIEGDEILVGYDAGSNALETNGSMAFFVEQGQTIANWQSFPIRIHYRCDQTSVCLLTRAGGAGLRARMRR